MNLENTQVLLDSRPKGNIDSKTFKIVKNKIENLKDGEIVVANMYLSLDPAMRGWLNEARSYIEPVKIGDVMRGGTVGKVIYSKNPKFKVGDDVSLTGGWQLYTVSDGKGVQKVNSTFPLSVHLGVLGMTGLTAYFGLMEVGKPQKGETIVISGAAGATGSVVGQIAKILGLRVVGIAGSDDKCKWLVDELGFDYAINYKDTKNMNLELKKGCPSGVDIYFDNVGGDLLDELLRKINLHGRIVICGAISQYNSSEVKGPKNYMSLLVNRARMEGFVVFDYVKQFPQALQQMSNWIKEGKLKYHEHIVQGLENAPEALNLLFSGKNSGKLIVEITKSIPQLNNSKL